MVKKGIGRNSLVSKGISLSESVLDSKKGQLTAFIIIGLILITVTAIFLYIRQGATERAIEVPEITESIPSELQPVRSAVEQCINLLGTDAVKLIGIHGGYIGTSQEDFRYTSRAFNTFNSVDRPTESEVLAVDNAGEWTVPYWRFMDSANDCRSCRLTLNVPPLSGGASNSISSQISKYVSSNLAQCLGGFAQLQRQGFTITERAQPVITTTITQSNVFVFAQYPLDVTYQERTASVSQYRSIIKVNLEKMYNLAVEIIDRERNSSFIEQHTLNVISGFSDVDAELPPTGGVDFSFTSKLWLKSEVVKKLQELLILYVGALQVTNTKNFVAPDFGDDTLKTAIYNSMVIPINGQYPQFDVRFSYQDWPIYFYISKDDPIRSREGATFPLMFLILPIQNYDLPYDVSFPVLAEIRDPSALEGRGYSFFFSMEGNIRNNEPLAESSEQLSSPSTPAQTSVCDQRKRTSGDVSFTLKDRLDNPIPNATVSFTVGSSTCMMGFTDMEGSVASFSSKFPKGAIGSLKIEHIDYVPKIIPLFKASDEPNNLGTIILEKYISKRVKVMKYNIGGSQEEGPMGITFTGWNMAPLPVGLNRNEEVIVMMQRKKIDAADSEHFAFADVRYGEEKEMLLYPGTYSLNVMLLQNNVTIKIPERSSEEGGFAGIGTETVTYPEVMLAENGPFMTSYSFEDVMITDAVFGNNDFVVYGLNFDLNGLPERQRKHSDLEVWGKVGEMANYSRDALLPHFERRP
ncbi:MAG TPA: hypothetical protein VJI75_05205 [Candidatus Nanoarchaeia archaeon]|nr:hypothetical protein [Candidatus Nanoarchaeia archaeon]